jgi:hypothetical protein
MIRVLVVTSGEMGLVESTINLAEGSTISDALRLMNVPEVAAPCGVWGRVRPLTHVLRDDDRVEVYAPLKADPKEARRAKVPARRRKF